MAGNVLRVGMGEIETGGINDTLCAYGIGSCVVVVCYDTNKPVAGMLHAMLPEKTLKAHEKNKYADTGIENLVKALIEKGVNIKDMRAKIFGGAKMFDTGSGNETIGDRNVKKAREILGKKGIILEGEDTGSNYGRTIEFLIDEKKAYVRSFSSGSKII
jgi:chemotaxis protein CheD